MKAQNFFMVVTIILASVIMTGCAGNNRSFSRMTDAEFQQHLAVAAQEAERLDQAIAAEERIAAQQEQLAEARIKSARAVAQNARVQAREAEIVAEAEQTAKMAEIKAMPIEERCRKGHVGYAEIGYCMALQNGLGRIFK